MKLTKNSLAALLASVLIAGMASLALAQGPGGPGGGFPGEGGAGFGGPGQGGPGMQGGAPNQAMQLILLLSNEAVQKEIGLTKAQIGKLKKCVQGFQGNRQNLGNKRNSNRQQGNRQQGDWREMAQEMRQKAEKLEQDINSILNDSQRQRLEQIGLQLQFQMRGIEALGDKKIIKELNFTQEQKEKLRALHKETQAELDKLRPQRPRQGGFMQDEQPDPSQFQTNFAELLEKQAKVRTDSLAKAKEILTSEQKQKLNELLGNPFELKMDQFQPQGPGGRRGAEGRQGGQRRWAPGGNGNSQGQGSPQPTGQW